MWISFGLWYLEFSWLLESLVLCLFKKIWEAFGYCFSEYFFLTQCSLSSLSGTPMTWMLDSSSQSHRSLRLFSIICQFSVYYSENNSHHHEQNAPRLWLTFTPRACPAACGSHESAQSTLSSWPGTGYSWGEKGDPWIFQCRVIFKGILGTHELKEIWPHPS